MNKKLIGGVVAVALAAAAGVGLVATEKRAFETALRDFAAAAPEGVSIEADITGSDFFSTDFSVRIGEAAGNFAARWQGRAEYGFGTVVRASLDDRRDLGRVLADMGVAGFRDELEIEWAPWRKEVPVRWRTAGFDYLPDGKAGPGALTCTVEPLRFEGAVKDGRFVRFDYAGEGFGCSAGGRQQLSVKDFALCYEEKAAPDAETLKHLAPLFPSEASLRVGVISGEGFSMKSLALASTLAKAADAEKTGKAEMSDKTQKTVAGEKPDARWRQTFDGAVESPVFENAAIGDRIAVRLHLEGLTQTLADNLVGLQVAMLALGDESLLAAGAVEAVEDAFMRGGLALNLETLSLEHKGERAEAAGRIAFMGDAERDRAAAFDPNRGVSLGALSVSVPASMIDEKTAAPFIESGALRLVSGFYQSHLELSTTGVRANGVPIF